MSHECIVTSSREGIFTGTMSSITSTIVHTPISTDATISISITMTHLPSTTDPEIAMFWYVLVNPTEPSLVALMTGIARSTLTAYDKLT